MTVVTTGNADFTERIDDEATSEFSFAFELDRIQRVMEEFKSDGTWIKGSFADDHWVFQEMRAQNIGYHTHFDFSRLDPIISFRSLNDLKLMIKFWVAQLLENYIQQTARCNYHDLIWALEISNGLSPDHIGVLSKAFMNITNENKRADHITSVLNFIDYAQIEKKPLYKTKLMELRASIKKYVNVKKLPPSRDVLCFSYYLEKYIKDLGDGAEDCYYKLTFYPLLLWWKLTTIIPMRPSEFCTIERGCLSEEDSKTYLKLPRIKHNTKNVQIYDRVLINPEMAGIITDYLCISEEFGPSQTLVSFRSLAEAHGMLGRVGTRLHKRNMDYLNNAVLKILIQRFYLDILEKKYGVIIEKENWVRPNTTRHIAFISLMMQGISPAEVARLGGHVTIEAQYHYSGHVEYWIDTSVMKLLEKYKYTLSAQEQAQGGYISREIILASVKPGTTEVEIPLEIGYCSDEQQRCQTDISEIEGCIRL